MPGNLNSVLTVQERIAELAQRSPDFTFYSLAHHIDHHWLMEAYNRTRKDGAAGIDDVTGKQYADNLNENLQNLLGRLKGGRYKAPPVKRLHIPKGSGTETRPIGMPTFEDLIAGTTDITLLGRNLMLFSSGIHCPFRGLPTVFSKEIRGHETRSESIF